MTVPGRHRPLLFPLSGVGRLSRRALITQLGAAGFGLTILSVCSGSSDVSSATSGSTAGTDAPTTDPPATEAPATNPPPTNAPSTEPPATDASAQAEPDQAALQMQHVSFGFVSAYVLLRGNEAAVVDTGVSGSASSILEGLEMLGASWPDVRHVVLTHNHGDHAGGLADVLEEAPGATVYAGEEDLSRIQSSAPLQSIGDGDEVLGMGVLNTPGHTEGSISLFDTATGILVAGDAINGANGMIVGANPDFSANMVLAGQSIDKLAALDAQVAAFGHGGAPITEDVAAQLTALAAG